MRGISLIPAPVVSNARLGLATGAGIYDTATMAQSFDPPPPVIVSGEVPPGALSNAEEIVPLAFGMTD